MTKVSVIVPCHNSSIYLETCLNSLVHQTLEDIEIICVEDHSTDFTFSILKKYEKNYPKKIKVYFLTDQFGCSNARNLGLKHACGEYIGFVDSDDVVSLNMYEDFYQLGKENKIDVIESGIKKINNQEFIKKETFQTTQNHKELSNLMENPEDIYFTFPSCCNKLFSRSLIENSIFLPGKAYEDLSFTYSLLLKSKFLLTIYRHDYFYRNNPKSIMSEELQPTLQILDIIDIMKDFKKRCVDFKVDGEFKKQISSITSMHLIHKMISATMWKTMEERRMAIISSLYQIFNYYFPHFEIVEDNTLAYFFINELNRIQPYLSKNNPITNIEQEKKRFIELIKR